MYHLIEQEDDYVVVSKWPGVSVHKDEQDEGLTMRLAKDLGRPVYLVHRLDKVTSGIMVFAFSSESAARFGAMFDEHRIQKYYWAISDKKPTKKQGLIRGDMVKARRGSYRLAKSLDNPALTQFISLSFAPKVRLFLLKPHTGKTHQLRVALKSLAAPIIGDERYGETAAAAEHSRCYLHAYALCFEWKGQQKTYTALPVYDSQPESDLFTQLCQALKNESTIALSKAQHQHITCPWNIPWPTLPSGLSKTVSPPN